MAYSSIQDKIGVCVDCAARGDHSEKPIIAGRCKAKHYQQYRSLVALQKRNLKNEKSKIRNLSSISVPPNNFKKVKMVYYEPNVDLEKFFEDRMNSLYPKCENCGAERIILLDERYKKQWKSCQAHLLPKRHFKSIETHPLIAMILGSGYSGMCNCHDDYDHDWERASKMNIWPEVVRRFKILYPLITKEEHKFIPEILLETLK